MSYYKGMRYRIRFTSPKRTFYVEARDASEAFHTAVAIELVLERYSKDRSRSFRDAVIDALTSDEEDS